MSPDIVPDLRAKLRILERETGGLLESRDQCCGLTSSQCHTVLELTVTGMVSLNDLAAAMGQDASTLSRIIQGLVVLGLVRRDINEIDRRCVDITLTGRGRDVVGRIEGLNNAYFEQVLAEIPADRHGGLLESLTFLIEAIRRVNDRTGCCRPEAKP
jgi:DNA-binding MarR family transcriptional regulator